MGNRAYGAGQKDGYKKGYDDAIREMNKNNKRGCLSVIILMMGIGGLLSLIIKIL